MHFEITSVCSVLLVLLNMFNRIRAFGQIDLSKNSNGNFIGNNNCGIVEHNSNLNIEASNCQLNLVNNANGKIIAQNSKLDFLRCSNIKFTGNNNKAKLEGNPNAQFTGEDNELEAISNPNLVVSSNKSNLKLFNNKNGKIDVENATVHADSNENLEVSCKNCRVDVRNTINHELGQINENSINENQFELSIGSSSSRSFRSNIPFLQSVMSAMNILSSTSVNAYKNNIKFRVNFVDEAIIDDQRYKVGAYSFHLQPLTDVGCQLKVDDSGWDNNSLEKQIISDREVLVSATKDGKKQTLRIKGAAVSVESPTDTSVGDITVYAVNSSNI